MKTLSAMVSYFRNLSDLEKLYMTFAFSFNAMPLVIVINAALQ